MRIEILLSYLFLGLTLAAPIGPVNSARLEKGIENGFWHAWMVGIGSLLADGVFMLLIYFGMLRFLEIPIFQIFLWLFGAFVLIYSGIATIIDAQKLQLNFEGKRKDSLFRCFIIGFVMSITSPLSILFWLGIYGSILAQTASAHGTMHLLLYSCMIFLGLSLWDLCVAVLTTGLRKFLNKTSLVVISIISGISLIGFGCYFGILGIKALIS